MAIDRAMLVAARFRDDSAVEVYSAHFDQSVRLELEDLSVDSDKPWSRYVVGIIALLRRQSIECRGGRFWIGGNVPPGAGLGSSAALEVGVALALLSGAGKTLRPLALATLCRQAEQEFANSPCGIMDQRCCTSAKVGHALLIDCRSTLTEAIPLNIGEAVLVVIDSGVRHSIAGAQYTARRRECSAALATINRIDRSVTSLRDVPDGPLAPVTEHLDDTLTRRIRHVVTENARVARAADALRAGDVSTLGRLMSESHASLRDDFEVSCAELDAIVSIAQDVEGVYGARMTGGGFGGCAIAIASRDAVEPIRSAIREFYDNRFDTPASVFPVRSADAASLISPLD